MLLFLTIAIVVLSVCTRAQDDHSRVYFVAIVVFSARAVLERRLHVENVICDSRQRSSAFTMRAALAQRAHPRLVLITGQRCKQFVAMLMRDNCDARWPSLIRSPNTRILAARRAQIATANATEATKKKAEKAAAAMTITAAAAQTKQARTNAAGAAA